MVHWRWMVGWLWTLVWLVPAVAIEPAGRERPRVACKSPAVSPDGRTVAFAHLNLQHPRWSIWGMGADGSNQRPFLMKETDLTDPRWSRDGRSLYYLNTLQGEKQVWRYDLISGTDEPITHLPGLLAYDLAHDGTRLVVSMAPPGQQTCDTMAVVGATSGKVLRQFAIAGTSPVWSPDDRVIACLARGSVVFQPVTDTGKTTTLPLNVARYQPNVIGYAPSGELSIGFRSLPDPDRPDSSLILTIDPTSGKVTHRYAENFPLDGFAWSRDGGTLFIGEVKSHAMPSPIVALTRSTDIARTATVTDLDLPYMAYIGLDTAQIPWIDVSPDGTSCVFLVQAPSPGGNILYWAQLDGTGLRKLLEYPELDGARFSPDGQQLVVRRRATDYDGRVKQHDTVILDRNGTVAKTIPHTDCDGFPYGACAPVTWAADGKALLTCRYELPGLWLHEGLAAQTVVSRYDLINGTNSPIMIIDGHVAALESSPDGAGLWYTCLHDDVGDLQFLYSTWYRSLANPRQPPVQVSEPGIISAPQCSPDSRRAIFVHHPSEHGDEERPPSIVIVDQDRKSRRETLGPGRHQCADWKGDRSSYVTVSDIRAHDTTDELTLEIVEHAMPPGSAPIRHTRIGTPRPVFHPSGGLLHDDRKIQITCAMKDATIHYTTDGTLPTERSPRYTGPITITGTTNIMAIATLTNGLPSALAVTTYCVSAFPNAGDGAGQP